LAYGVTAYGDTPQGRLEALKAANKGADLGTSIGNALATSINGGYVKPFQEQKITNRTENVPTTTLPTASPTASMPNNSAQDYINRLNAAKLQANMAALGKSRDAALSNLGQEQAGIQPKYYDAKNQVAAGAQQQARNFAEFMAQRGGTSAGSNAQATISDNMTTQNNLGSLGRQEAAAYTDIGRRTTDVQNAYQSDVASATAGGEADKMNALLNDYYQQQQRELQIAQLTAEFQGKPTLAGKQFDLSAQNQGFNQNLATQQFQYGQGQDAIKNQQWEQTFNENVRQYGQDYALKKLMQDHNISQDQAQLAVSQMNARTSAASAGNSSSNARINQLMDVWKNTGKAPVGLESLGVQPNEVYHDYVAARQGDTPVKIDAKTSADNYSTVLSDLKTKGITSATANQLIETNKDFLSDADYRSLKKYVTDNIK
jgi:hypothetical protein